MTPLNWLLVGAVSFAGIWAYMTGFFGGDKIAICHATGSEANPYVEIRVSQRALSEGHSEHAVHVNDIIPAPEEGCEEGDGEEPPEV